MNIRLFCQSTASMLAVACAFLVGPSPTHADRTLSDIAGRWDGRMECKQGPLNVTLSITRRSGDLLSAVFAFSALPEGPAVPSGSFEMQGSVTPNSMVTLQPTGWIDRPSGYDGLSGPIQGLVSGDGSMTLRFRSRDCRGLQLSYAGADSGAAVATADNSAEESRQLGKCAFVEQAPAKGDGELRAEVEAIRHLVEQGDVDAALGRATQTVCGGDYQVSEKARQFVAMTDQYLAPMPLNTIAMPAGIVLRDVRKKELPSLSEDEKSAIFHYAMLARNGEQGCLAGRLLMLPALSGHGPSQMLLARDIAAGELCSMGGDVNEAFKLYEAAAEGGSRNAKIFVGVAHILGRGSPTRDKVEGDRILAAAIAEDNADAQFLAGMLLAGGMGGNPDGARAHHWLLKAARQGHAGSQVALGDLALAGVDPATGAKGAADVATAEQWYGTAADQGDDEGLYRLAELHEQRREFADALRRFRAAAEKGHPGALYAVGHYHLEGYGIAKDEAEATSWFLRAAEKGHLRAQTYVGYAYQNGRGVPQDDAEAVNWFAKAAKAGDVRAQEAMVSAYRSGRGVPRDPVQAQYWLRRAAEGGSEAAHLEFAEAELQQRMLIGFIQGWAAHNGTAECDTFYGISCNRGADMLGYHILTGK